MSSETDNHDERPKIEHAPDIFQLTEAEALRALLLAERRLRLEADQRALSAEEACYAQALSHKHGVDIGQYTLNPETRVAQRRSTGKAA